MPGVPENARKWSKTYPRSQKGEEWSKIWGGSEAQWFFVIYPRIHLFIPAETILEIAPGYGRWTEWLKGYCKRLVGVDPSGTCVEACKQRFAGHAGVSFHVNDGRSLPMVAPQSVHFAFSFDSLVHAENDVLAAYLEQLSKKLAPDGIAFVHHSNMGAHLDPKTGALPSGVPNPHWRAVTVSARGVVEQCLKAGMQCVSQEIVNWGGNHLTDCFSVVTRVGSPWARENLVVENPDFMTEAFHVARLSRLYTPVASPAP
jgi:SAM-dependent methyltransferase